MYYITDNNLLFTIQTFHVHVNDLPVKRNLDIFREAHAAGVAYDLYIDVSIRKKEITIGDVIGDINGELQIRLIQVADNPKINAIAILTGKSDTLPSPPAPVDRPSVLDTSRRRSRKEVIEEEEEEEEEDDHVEIDEDFSFSAHKQDRPSAPEKDLTDGPRIFDPYADRNDNVFIYLGVTLVCLLPVVAFLMHM
ncbi:unnamed protein product [Heligmosomoides polygyrus]|uniref:Malectin domain-containing protein n=1 Tax=Heligmosomoides polygyrus TaxID=6339 RepID=A0A3P7YVJ5_HELPZ|nr:unnamed protein product [Heligmosomoides polygyrus]